MSPSRQIIIPVENAGKNDSVGSSNAAPSQAVGLSRSQRLGVKNRRNSARDSFGDWAAAIVCSLSISSVPIFSYQESLSFIPQLLCGIAVLVSIANIIARREDSVPFHPALLAYFGLVVYFSFTLLIRPDVADNYLTLLKVCIIAGASYYSFRSPRLLRFLLGAYSISSACTLFLNWTELQDLHIKTSIGGAFNDSDRFAGTLGNANTAALYGVVSVIASLTCFSSRKKLINFLLLLVGAFSGITLVYFSGSRKGVIGLIMISLMVPFVLGGTRKVNFKAVVILALSLPTLVYLSWELILLMPNSSRFLLVLSEGRYADGSTTERYEMLETAFHLWKQKPIFGYGFDGFTDFGGFGTYSHNTFTEILTNGGIIGCALILMFYISPIVQLGKIIANSQVIAHRPFHFGLLGFWLVFAIFSIFAVLYNSRDFVPICFAIVGYLAHLQRTEETVR
jgi:O-antigen ligase